MALKWDLLNPDGDGPSRRCARDLAFILDAAHVVWPTSRPFGPDNSQDWNTE